MIRMDQISLAKKIFESKPEGRRIVRKPRQRLLEDVGNDL
jgi:hypothetical protein